LVESPHHRKISSLNYDYYLSGGARQILNAFPEHISINSDRMKPLVENIHKKLSPDKFVSCTLAVDNLWIQKKLCRPFPPGYPPIFSRTCSTRRYWERYQKPCRKPFCVICSQRNLALYHFRPPFKKSQTKTKKLIWLCFFLLKYFFPVPLDILISYINTLSISSL